MELTGHAASPGEQQETVRQVQGLPIGARARHRSHDLLDARRRSLADLQPAPEGLQDDYEVALRKALPQKLSVAEELGEAEEVFGFGRDDRRVGE